MNDLMGFVKSDADERLLKSIPTGEDCPEELNKAMNKAGLTQKEIQVQGKNGTYTKKVWVRTGEKSSKTESGSNLTEEEMDRRLSVYKKDEPDITKLSDEHLSKLFNDTKDRITKLESKTDKTDDDKTWLHGCKKRIAKYENEMKLRKREPKEHTSVFGKFGSLFNESADGFTVQDDIDEMGTKGLEEAFKKIGGDPKTGKVLTTEDNLDIDNMYKYSKVLEKVGDVEICEYNGKKYVYDSSEAGIRAIMYTK